MGHQSAGKSQLVNEYSYSCCSVQSPFYCVNRPSSLTVVPHATTISAHAEALPSLVFPLDTAVTPQGPQPTRNVGPDKVIYLCCVVHSCPSSVPPRSLLCPSSVPLHAILPPSHTHPRHVTPLRIPSNPPAPLSSLIRTTSRILTTSRIRTLLHQNTIHHHHLRWYHHSLLNRLINRLLNLPSHHPHSSRTRALHPPLRSLLFSRRRPNAQNRRRLGTRQTPLLP